jgi:hypothetical protein
MFASNQTSLPIFAGPNILVLEPIWQPWPIVALSLTCTDWSIFVDIFDMISAQESFMPEIIF